VREPVSRVKSRYVERRVDWTAFQVKLTEDLPLLDDAANSDTVDDRAAAVTNVLTRACNASMPTFRTRSARSVP